MIHEDGYHLTSESVAMLAANIKHAIDRVSHASGDSRGSPTRQGGLSYSDNFQRNKREDYSHRAFISSALLFQSLLSDRGVAREAVILVFGKNFKDTLIRCDILLTH
jgi:hypothetical protein